MQLCGYATDCLLPTEKAKAHYHWQVIRAARLAYLGGRSCDFGALGFVLGVQKASGFTSPGFDEDVCTQLTKRVDNSWDSAHAPFRRLAGIVADLFQNPDCDSQDTLPPLEFCRPRAICEQVDFRNCSNTPSARRGVEAVPTY